MVDQRKSTLHKKELIIIAILLAGALLTLLVVDHLSSKTNLIAQIYCDTELVMSIDLDGTPNKIIDIPNEPNIHFQIEDHQLRFYQVTCPDKLCEQVGFLRKEGDIAICMPNHYYAKIISKQS